MKRLWLVVVVGAALLAAIGDTAVAQDEATVLLTIRLRDSDGRPVAGAVVKASRLPEDTAVTCTTDDQGQCVWPVTPGLYQLFFTRPLDELTAVILGEGGLNGLGVMVGEAPNGEAPIGNKPITYHFTFHSDDRVYFDLAPDAPQPLPKIPTAEDVHVHEGDHDHTAAQPSPIVPVTTAVFVAAALVIETPVATAVPTTQALTVTQPLTLIVTTTTPTTTPTTTAVSPLATPLPFATPPSRPSPLFILLLAAGGGLGAGYLTQRLYAWLAGRKNAPAMPTDDKDGP